MSALASEPRRRGPGRRLGLAVASLVATGLLLEAGLRVAGYGDADRTPYRFVTVERQRAESEAGGLLVPDARLFWRLRAGWTDAGSGEGIGAQGFRTPEFAAARQEGTLRVVCLGDSSVFGLGVTRERTWPREAERLLRERADGSPTEVLNLGVPGYTSWQGRLLLEDRLDDLDPDVVVLAFGAFNDWVPALDAPDRLLGAPRGGWRVARLVADAFSAGSTATGLDEAQDVSLLRTASYEGPRRVPPDAFAEDLAAMHALARARRARVVLVAQPLPASTLEANPIAVVYADRMRAFARDEGLGLVDGWDVFRGSGEADELLFRDFCHPTERGHALLAAALARALEDAGDGD